MPGIILLPDWNVDASWDGIIGNVIPYDPKKAFLRDVKSDWQPKPEPARSLQEVEAFAFPTPFAWAEMMSAIIRQELWDHILFKHYEQLVLGLSLGYLQLEILDLELIKGGGERSAFGGMLARTEPRYRYFGLLRGRGTPENPELDGKVFGGTSPDCLFWPSPRPAKSDWRRLQVAIDQEKQDPGYRMLAALRSLLQGAKMWDPMRSTWMKGLEAVIGNHVASDNSELLHRHYQTHSRAIGPILADFHDGKDRPLYFPVYEKEFAPNFLRGLTGAFKLEDGRIGVYDQVRKCFEILLPTLDARGDVVLAGTGVVRAVAQPSKQMPSDQIHLHDEGGQRGLYSLMQNLRRRFGDDVQEIKQRPFLQPDVFRIPVTRMGEAGLSTLVSFSREAYRLTFDPDTAGLPLADELEQITSETSGVAVEYDDKEGNPRKAIYIDAYAGSRVGDLRALGWVLWSYFISPGSPDAESHGFEIRDGNLCDEELTPIFDLSSRARPFELLPGVAGEIYQRVLSGDNQEHRRLATLQRFYKAYRQLAEEPGAAPTAKLCYRAAQSFVQWAWPGDGAKSLLANGRAPRTRSRIELSGLQAMLLRDE